MRELLARVREHFHLGHQLEAKVDGVTRHKVATFLARTWLRLKGAPGADRIGGGLAEDLAARLAYWERQVAERRVSALAAKARERGRRSRR